MNLRTRISNGVKFAAFFGTTGGATGALIGVTMANGFFSDALFPLCKKFGCSPSMTPAELPDCLCEYVDPINPNVIHRNNTLEKIIDDSARRTWQSGGNEVFGCYIGAAIGFSLGVCSGFLLGFNMISTSNDNPPQEELQRRAEDLDVNNDYVALELKEIPHQLPETTEDHKPKFSSEKNRIELHTSATDVAQHRNAFFSSQQSQSLLKSKSITLAAGKSRYSPGSPSH